MFNQHRVMQYKLYNAARGHLIANYQQLIELEHYFMEMLTKGLETHLGEIKQDYNEASYLYPFWQNYPPDERGRAPRGDQYPWIEVGEHAVGEKLGRILGEVFEVRDVGIPTGPDRRYVVKSSKILDLTGGLTDSAWIFVDIKSVGPRDDHAHAVMSHNQISGNGYWFELEDGLKNTIMTAKGKYSEHAFHSSVPPIYVLSDETVLPVINFCLKPVYGMLSLGGDEDNGQPLNRLELVSIPNGLLLEEAPGYLKQYPSLIYPGKDDKQKNPLKIRARVDFKILKKIDNWRVKEILI